MANRIHERSTKYLGTTSDLVGPVLADGEEAVVNAVAFLNTATGEIQASASATTLLPLGYFTKAQTGDGDTACYPVRLFRELGLNAFTNDDSPNEVAEADIGSECYFKDGTTVSMLGTSRSKAGRVMGIYANGLVLVEGGPAVTGPTGDGVSTTAQAIATQTRFLPIMLDRLSTGGPIPAFSNGSADGYSLEDSEALCLRINNSATPAGFAAAVALPEDVDTDEDLIVRILAAKSGATLADATTFDVVTAFHSVGALWTADTLNTDVTDAMVGDATAKTVQEVFATIAAADVPAAPCVMSIRIKPTDDLLDTDDVCILGVTLEYTPKVV